GNGTHPRPPVIADSTDWPHSAPRLGCRSDLLVVLVSRRVLGASAAPIGMTMHRSPRTISAHPASPWSRSRENRPDSSTNGGAQTGSAQFFRWQDTSCARADTTAAESGGTPSPVGEIREHRPDPDGHSPRVERSDITGSRTAVRW